MKALIRKLALGVAFAMAACVSRVPSQQPAQQPAPPSAQQAAPARASVSPLDAAVYHLAGGDMVRVDVLGEPDLSLEALIDPSGYINYPFLGKVQASGLTVRDLEIRIRNGLKAGYLVNPDVRVALARYRPVFIAGQVRTPGAYPYSLGLNVERALTLAGGVTAYGSTSRVYIQRHGAGAEKRIRATLDAPVYPGDYIIIEERLF